MAWGLGFGALRPIIETYASVHRHTTPNPKPYVGTPCETKPEMGWCKAMAGFRRHPPSVLPAPRLPLSVAYGELRRVDPRWVVKSAWFAVFMISGFSVWGLTFSA